MAEMAEEVEMAEKAEIAEEAAVLNFGDQNSGSWLPLPNGTGKQYGSARKAQALRPALRKVGENPF
jgi:hypothetical protein